MVRHLRRWRDLVDQLGYRPGQILAYLDRLAAHRLACVDPAGRWRATHLGRRDRAAALPGAAGVLAGRIKRHRLERAAWSWWQEELTWRRATPHQRLRTPGPDQPPLPDLLTLPARRHGPPPPETAAPTTPQHSTTFASLRTLTAAQVDGPATGCRRLRPLDGSAGGGGFWQPL